MNKKFILTICLLLSLTSSVRAQGTALHPKPRDAGIEDAQTERNENAAPLTDDTKKQVRRFLWTEAGHELSLLIYKQHGQHDAQQLQLVQKIRQTLHQLLTQRDPLHDGSALATINRSENATQFLSPEIFDLVQSSQNIAKRSHGAWDPSIFSLRQAWGFYAQGRVPAPQAIEDARRQVSYTAIHLDDKTQSMTRTLPLLLDLRPMSEGQSLDLAAKKLRKTLGDNYVLRIDNQVLVRGSKGDEAWSVGIQDPHAAGTFAVINTGLFSSDPLALSTVSDAHRYFFVSGTRYHDIIDPRDGQPARRAYSATVIGPRAQISAGLAYALFVLGPAQGLALIEATPGYAAIIVDADRRVWLSSKMRGKVAYRPPTDAP